MSRSEIIKKLQLYKTKPEMFAPLTPNELADLVTIVLSQVNEIEKQIKLGNDFATRELTATINKAIKDHRSENERIEQELEAVRQEKVLKISETLNKKLTEADVLLNNALYNLQKRVDEIKDGEVTEAEIARAAQVALTLLELPDFEAMVSNAINSDSEAIRNALELLQGEDRYKVEIADVQGLTETLNQLAQIRGAQGGTIGKQQVYGFIRQAISDGTITTSDSLPDQTGNNGKFLTTDGSTASWGTPAGGSGTIETPTGSVNGSNVTFTVSATPLFLISDNTIYVEGFGYSIVGTTVTMELAPYNFIRAVI